MHKSFMRPAIHALLAALLLLSGAAFGQGKPGPKPKGTGAHNEKVEEVAREEKAKGMEYLGGGVGGKEKVIQTEGGNKESRRADLTFQDPATKQITHHQVGLTNSKGEPIKREKEALEDIRTKADEKNRNVIFHPYTPPPPKKK